MRSFTDVAAIANNATAILGPARLGVRWADVGPPVRAEIIVMPSHGADSAHEITLGETFPVGEETWRFADLAMSSLDEWEVIVRRVDGSEAPPTGRPWERARLSPYGRLDEAQLQAVEAALGQPLPPDYRDWLRRNNGAQPEVDHHVPGVTFTLMPERPLFGVHPQHPPTDLVPAQRVHRDPWLSPEWLVIARPSGGLLLVSTAKPHDSTVYFLPEQDMVGPASDAREHKLRPVAGSMPELVGRLAPLDVAHLPPAQLAPFTTDIDQDGGRR